MFDIDFMSYSLVAHAAEFDVIAAPNLFGDVLSDLGGLLLGSRGVTFSGNFSSDGKAVYQTNHGAAYGIAGRDVANPTGQIFSLSMLLRESLGLAVEAQAMEQAVRDVWADNYRTSDTATQDAQIVGCREMGELVGDRAAFLLSGRNDADRNSSLASG